jgi:hypothetical protein
LAQESLEQFSKDEAALFDLPDEEEKFSKKINERGRKRKKQLSNTKEDDLEEDPQTLPPGAENVDDIIDELD